MTPYQQPESQWAANAQYHENGLPANMDAILHDQWKRNRRRAGFVSRNRGGLAGHEVPA
jgi:hypothetical protein